jgi:hypothetical protein
MDSDKQKNPSDKPSDYLQKNGAGDGSRTRDPKLGKLVLYQLSYARFSISIIAAAILVVN